MTRRCSLSNCYAHEDEGCQEGHLKKGQCPYWTGSESAPTEALPAQLNTSSGVLWSSNALGLMDLANLTPRARTILIGVLGAYDAGKTTLLTANYLQLLRGKTLADARFAGSRTLGAWESLAAWTRFDDAARRPSFPPHTERGTSRVPGILHIALRGPHDEFRDVLLTDAPGEWFTSWAVNEDSPESEGARWICEKADAFLVVADCERLCGAGRGNTRKDIRQLIDRLGNHVEKRPTALVWAKADHKPEDGVRNAIRRRLNDRIPHATEVESTTDKLPTTTLALEEVLRPAWTPQRALLMVEPIIQHSPFAAFRGHHAHT